METVEDLMVGEEASPQTVVHKAGMQCAVYRLEGQVAAPLAQFVAIENLSQALRLLHTVGKDIQAVALQHIVFEGAGEQFEILVEKGLGRDVKRDGGVGCSGRTLPELYAAEAGYPLIP